MVDYNKEMVEALSSVLPTHPELFLHSGLDVPCISYLELSNNIVVQSDKMDYSSIVFQIKVWANSIEDIQRYAKEIDLVLRPLGFKRINSGELRDNQSTMIQKILTYEALASETY